MKFFTLFTKRYIQGAITLWLLLTLITAPSFASSTKLKNTNNQLEPLSDNFLEFKKQPRFNYDLNYTPPPVSLAHVHGILDDQVNNTSYPSRFDLRDYNRTSPVKDQLIYYTCWIFAAFTSLESCLLPDEIADFSEWHLALNHGFDNDLDGGGNSFMTTAYLIRWSGPVSETTAPYGSSNQSGISYPPAKHVQQVVFLPDREDSLDNNTIKYFLMQYGPLDFAANWSPSGFNSATNAFYIPGNSSQNHRLAMVGWDDDFPASNFKSQPPGNGAFIARQSWGESWGEQGYCYISYYDRSVQEMISFNSAEPTTNYSTIYQYDPLGRTRGWGSETAWGANIFTAVNTNPIEAVGFYSFDANMQYQIKIYQNPAPGSPASGTLALSQSGQLIYPGYYTIKLTQPVPLQQGATFSVVVKFMNSEHRYAVPVEYPVKGHATGAESSPGQSFISEDGLNWTDLWEKWQNTNVCIKAYARYNKAQLHLEAERKKESAWVISRDYAEITMQMENPENASLENIILYRSKNGEEFEEFLQLLPQDLENKTFIFQDKYLDRSSEYTYMIKAFDSQEALNSQSSAITI